MLLKIKIKWVPLAPSLKEAERVTMRINMLPEKYAECVFLGGTCGKSTWRAELISLLDDTVPYFDPMVNSWTKEDGEREDVCKPLAAYNVFVITPDGLSTYTGWELHEEASRAPEKLIFCTVGEIPSTQIKRINKIKNALIEMGSTVCNSLEEIAKFLNEAY